MSRMIATFFLILAYHSAAQAECRNCAALKRARLIGIKLVKEVIQRKGNIRVFATEKRAESAGFVRFSGCQGETQAQRRCGPVFAVISSGVYFCPSSLRTFASQRAAELRGFSPYSACGTAPVAPTPTPTAIPDVTPRPLERRFSVESGARFSNVDSLSVLPWSGGGYRAYVGPSSDSLRPDTLRYLDSADGLSFGDATAITGIEAGSVTTFAFPAPVFLSDGSLAILYERIRHVSSGGIDINSLFRAVSSDGRSFANVPDSALSFGGELSLSSYRPAVVRLGDATLRIYLPTSSALFTTSSADGGATLSSPEEAVVLGRSDDFAPFIIDPTVVLDSNGTYQMYFSSPRTSTETRYALFLAESADGKTFYVMDQPVLAPEEDTTLQDPAAVILPDGRVRLYFIERAVGTSNSSRLVRSAISE